MYNIFKSYFQLHYHSYKLVHLMLGHDTIASKSDIDLNASIELINKLPIFVEYSFFKHCTFVLSKSVLITRYKEINVQLFV